MLERHQKRYSKRERKEIQIAYLFLLPSLVGVLVFIMGPIIASLLISFSEWNLLSTIRFAGLTNYVKLLGDDLFWLSLKNTLYYSLLTIPSGLLISLLLALIMNVKLRGMDFYRTIYYIPVVCSMVAVSLVWKWIYNREFGLLNYFLSFLNVPPIGWIVETKWAMPAIALMSVWKNLGFNAIIFLAGLQNIPSQLYEVAKLDGASGWKQFCHITIPLLSPTIFFLTVVSIISSFQVFDAVYMMTQGGPGNATAVYTYFLYCNAFRWFKMGYACALAYVLFILIFGLVFLQFKYIFSKAHYERI